MQRQTLRPGRAGQLRLRGRKSLLDVVASYFIRARAALDMHGAPEEEEKRATSLQLLLGTPRGLREADAALHCPSAERPDVSGLQTLQMQTRTRTRTHANILHEPAIRGSMRRPLLGHAQSRQP